VLLLLAFLPSVTYVGHWSTFIHAGMGHADTAADAAAHAAHCHYGPANCSQQQIAAADTRGVAQVVEIAEPDLLQVRLAESPNVLEEFVSNTPTDPPRHLTS
jgi:hypothetical protein